VCTECDTLHIYRMYIECRFITLTHLRQPPPWCSSKTSSFWSI